MRAWSFPVVIALACCSCGGGQGSAEGSPDASTDAASAWPTTMILVHGYAAGSAATSAAAGIDGTSSRYDDFWYWQSLYSDDKTSYDVPAALTAAAADDGVSLSVVAANWDGISKVEDAVSYLAQTLDCFCTGVHTCDVVGHSTGDALIGYALDQVAVERPVTLWSTVTSQCVPTGATQQGWNVKAVYVAGGAGGGTEAADYDQYFSPDDPVVAELVPATMRALYDHAMHGLYAGVANVRFVGAGLEYDSANDIPYATIADLVRGDCDGLVPFHSQGGVSQYVGSLVTQAYDAYCITESTGAVYSCGQLDLGQADAVRWGYVENTEIPLFQGFTVAMIDDARLYNHSDEVGRLGEWIPRYKHAPAPWTTVP